MNLYHLIPQRLESILCACGVGQGRCTIGQLLVRPANTLASGSGRGPYGQKKGPADVPGLWSVVRERSAAS